MDSPKELRVSNLLEEITSKENWYTKIFDPVIIEKWSNEVKGHESPEDFNLAIKLLQTTAQGSSYKYRCSWEEGSCKQCLDIYGKKINDAGFLKSNHLSFDEAKDVCDELTYDSNMLAEYVGKCKHKRCECISPHMDLYDYAINGCSDTKLNTKILNVINEIKKNEPIDHHPGSDNQVIDIIHPSVNCYSQGITKHNDGSFLPATSEDKMYSWLPAEFNVDANGRVTLTSRINNLDDEKYPTFSVIIEKIIETRLSDLEKVLKRNLKNQTLQIIVKVASIELTPKNPVYKGGSWHIEGMPYEYISASILEYLELTNITDSYLEFRKPVIISEENISYPQDDDRFTSYHYGLDGHHEGKMNKYLGLIKCNKDSYVIFPNTLQHRVKKFSLKNPKEKGTRTILALFVVDPDHKIISTKDVPLSTWTKKEIDHHRLRLMFHRKYFVKQFNKEVFEREYSLCEH